MTMNRVLNKSGPLVETTIVPALPLLRLPPEENARRQEESRAVGPGNGVVVANLPMTNGVASGANEYSLPKQHILVPPAAVEESVWRGKNMKPVDFGNTRGETGGRLCARGGGPGGVGRSGVMFGDLGVANPDNISNGSLSGGLSSPDDTLNPQQPLAEGTETHQSPSTTPPPTAMLNIFHSQPTPPYHAANYRGTGHPYSSPPFPHGPEGFGGMPLPPHHLRQRHSPHPHHPTDSMSSSIDGGGFQYLPPHQQMLPSHPHFPPHSQPHFQHHPYPPPQYPPNRYPNPGDPRPPTTDGPSFYAHNPHPIQYQYPQLPYPEFYPASISNPSGSSGHVSPFPPPPLPYPSSAQGQFFSHIHPLAGSPLFQQLDDSDQCNRSQQNQKQRPSSPALGHGVKSVNEQKVTNHILDQFGKPTFADLALKLTFSSYSGDERVLYCLELPFHSLVGARMGVTVKILEERGLAGSREMDRDIQVSLDDILREEEGVMDRSVKWTTGNLMKFLTETAVRIALAWIYGCSERLVEEWFEYHTAHELQNMISRIQPEELMEPGSDGKFVEPDFSVSSSPAAEEMSRGHRSDAPSPEPITHVAQRAEISSRPPSRNLLEDDTEGEDLERQLSNPETQATTPHQEAPSRKLSRFSNTPGVWPPGLMPSHNPSLKRILSVLAAATLLDIPELVCFCEKKLTTHIQSLDDLSSGLGTLYFLLFHDELISQPCAPSYVATDRFSHVHAMLFEIFSATMTDVIGRCLDRLAHGCKVEELDQRVLRGLPFEVVVGTALSIVDGMKVLQSVKERIDVVRKLVVGEIQAKEIVVAASFGVTPTVARITKGSEMRFGEVEGLATAANVAVGRRVRRKFVWVES